MNIPTSVVKISFLNNAYNTEFRYMGMKAEWAKVSIAEKPKKSNRRKMHRRRNHGREERRQLTKNVC